MDTGMTDEAPASSFKVEINWQYLPFSAAVSACCFIFRSLLQLVTLIILILWPGQGLLVVVVAHYNLASNYIL